MKFSIDTLLWLVSKVVFVGAFVLVASSVYFITSLNAESDFDHSKADWHGTLSAYTRQNILELVKEGKLEGKTQVNFRFLDFDPTNELLRVAVSVDIGRDVIKEVRGEPGAKTLYLRVFSDRYPSSSETRNAERGSQVSSMEIDQLLAATEPGLSIRWEVGEFSLSPTGFVSEYPNDKYLTSIVISLDTISGRGRTRGLPIGSPHLVNGSTFEYRFLVAPALVGWKLEIGSPLHLSKYNNSKRLFVLIGRETSTILYAWIFIASLLTMAVALFVVSLIRSRKNDAEHWEDAGSLAALAIAIPGIRALLSAPSSGLPTILDGWFLLIFALAIAGMMLRVSALFHQYRTR